MLSQLLLAIFLASLYQDVRAENSTARVSIYHPSSDTLVVISFLTTEITPSIRALPLNAPLAWRQRTLNIWSADFSISSPASLVTLIQTLRDSGIWAKVNRLSPGRSPTFLKFEARLVSSREDLIAKSEPVIQSAAARISRSYPWRHYNPMTGLSGLHVRKIKPDKSGRLWFATDSGVSVFSGQSWYTLPESILPNDSIWAIEHSEDESVWIGTLDGGAVRLGPDGSVLTLGVDELKSTTVRSIRELKDGSVALGKRGGVTTYRNGQIDHIPIDEIYGSYDPTSIWAITQDDSGVVWIGSDLGLARSVDGGWQAFPFSQKTHITEILSVDRKLLVGTDRGLYSVIDNQLMLYDLPLVENDIRTLLSPTPGEIWLGTASNGIQVFDSELLSSKAHHLAQTGARVRALTKDSDGNIWIGTARNGASQYLGEYWEVLSLPGVTIRDKINVVAHDSYGQTWLGGNDGLLAVVSGDSMTQIGSRNLPGKSHVLCILPIDEEEAWIGTDDSGLLRVTGLAIEQLTVSAGLPSNRITCLMKDSQERIWIGSEEGLICYDHGLWRVYTQSDGLGADYVVSLEEGPDQSLWVGTIGAGVSRIVSGEAINYRGSQGFRTNPTVWDIQRLGEDVFFATDDGLVRYRQDGFKRFGVVDGLTTRKIRALEDDQDGTLLVGTRGGGLNRYDGEVFQHFSSLEGLAHPEGQRHVSVSGVARAERGEVWITTEEGGLSILKTIRPSPPGLAIRSSETAWRYVRPKSIALGYGTEPLKVGFEGISLTSQPGELLYRYQLKGFDDTWHYSRSTVAEYRDLPRGSYEFIVQAIDPFCQYSDPIAVEVLVAVTPTQILHWVLLVTITITACVSIVIASAKHRKLRRTEQRLLEEATNELQKAHSLQMGLMPKQSPEIPGFSVYGTCRPAKEVGGDFYQYKTRNDSVLFTVADVTGHAMEAAIPAVMFSGLLEGATFEEITTEQLAHDLNTTLHDKLDRRTFVCFVAGKLDTSSKTLQICDCGCPYPYHFIAKTGELQELQMDAYPLGVSASTEYTSRLLRLEVDDYVVFCTDGIIETRNPRGEEMGFARVSELLQDSCRRGMPPADLVEHLIAQSDAFSKGAEQEDDITCVALKVDL